MDDRASEVFVGRRRELAELERALGAARAGSGAIVLVAGEAGIGKTRIASELMGRAREAGFEVLLGRSIDFVGTQLPYQPFVEALRPLGKRWQADRATPGSQLQVFEETLALLADRAASAPVLLVLEDLHWADASTLDLVVFLAHNIDDERVLVLGTYRADELESIERVRRLAEGLRRSGSARVLELGPLEREELGELLAARSDRLLPAGLADAIAARSEGNPFFAEELLAAAGERVELPQRLRDLLLQRVAGLDAPTQSVLRVAAAAGRDVAYSLLCATAELPERDVRDCLRRAVAHSILVAEPGEQTFRFRHALVSEAIYATLLPGEREELHGRLAEELAHREAATAAEVAPHWAAAGRAAEALAASVEAARQAESVFGLSEALSHLERALAQWDSVLPEGSAVAGLDLAELCAWTAELASATGDAPRAVGLTRRAIALVGESDRVRAGLLHQRLGRYLFESGAGDTFLAAFERAVELVPATPPSAESAQALSALANGLHLLWHHEESLAICEQALAVARTVGARDAELRALTTLGINLAYLGRGDEGLGQLRKALRLAEETADPQALDRAYISLTDVLTMLGRPREAARLGARGLEALSPFRTERTVLAANWIEALLATGEWDEADRASATALRALTANYPHMPLILRADLELGRGDFDGARSHLEAARPTVRHAPGVAYYYAYLAELALWERRWLDADQAVRDGIAWARPPWGAQLRVWLCAKGVRAHAELAALARARRDPDAVRQWLDRARRMRTAARRAARDAAAITPNVHGWSALVEAEHERALGVAAPEPWSEAAGIWDRLERPPLAAYCRWREAEALVAAGASRTEASAPLREAHGVATRIGATPLLRELELLAQRARLDLAPPSTESADGRQSLDEALGLTRREAEVLTLLARGYTDREIAATLTISIKTASTHVSHILRKLEVPNRHEAAAVAHRIAAAPTSQRGG